MRARIGTLVVALFFGLFAVNDVDAAPQPSAVPIVGGGCSLPRDVQMNPDACFKVSGVKIKDSGIVRSYRELSEVTLTNTSGYKISDVTGEVTWFKADGSTVGTTTFKLTGATPAGATTTFSQASKNLTTTKIQSDAPTYSLRLTGADSAAN